MTPHISIIAIVAHDGAIGRGGDQPFHISEDFRRFKALTLGHPIIMGRKTFDALPKGALPGRRNIVVTRSADWSAADVETASSLSAAIALCQPTDQVMIIGGGSVYAQAMDMAQRLYITTVDASVDDADTYFPSIDPQKWTLIEQSQPQTDPRSGASFRFLVYNRVTD